MGVWAVGCDDVEKDAAFEKFGGLSSADVGFGV